MRSFEQCEHRKSSVYISSFLTDLNLFISKRDCIVLFASYYYVFFLYFVYFSRCRFYDETDMYQLLDSVEKYSFCFEVSANRTAGSID